MRNTQSEPFRYSGKRVLVTGGCGFIGRHLVLRLLGAGCKVTILDDLSTGIEPNATFLHGTLDFVRGDVTDLNAVLKAVNVDVPSLVIHMASIVGQRLAKNNPARSYDVSTIGTQNVLNATQCPIMFLSSSAVYGHRHELPVSEFDATEDDAESYDGGSYGYATGKFDAEHLIASPKRAYTIVRPFNVVGPGQSGEYGMVLPRMVDAAMADKPITVYDDGGQFRSFSHVRTFVDCLMRLIHVDAPGVVNVGNPRSNSIYSLALEIALYRKGVPITTVPYESVFPGHKDVRVRVPDTSRLEFLVGPVEWPTMQEIVQEVMLCQLSK